MAAEYEAKIAELQTSKRRKNTDSNSGASGSRRVSKSDTLTKKDKLSAETIKANRERDILPILGDILQDLTRYANNATHECGELLMKAIHYAQAEWKGRCQKLNLCVFTYAELYVMQC